MKNISLLLLTISTFFIEIIMTNALTINNDSIVTKNGYILSKDEYNRLSENYSDAVIDSMPKDFIKLLSSSDLIKISYQEKYIVSNSLLDQNGNVILNFDKEVTKDEAIETAEKINKIETKGNSGQGSWSTNSKLLFISVYYSGGQYIIDEQCHWYTTPSKKSYDIIAARWTNSNFSTATAYGVQEYWDNSAINYSYLGSNMVSLSKGVGISMNLVDSGSDYKLYLFIKGTSNPGTTYGTYQHATSNISLNTSKSYTFTTSPNSGLGGVLNHNYPSYFDNMQGVMTN